MTSQQSSLFLSTSFWGCLATSLKLMKRVYCVVDALDEMEVGHDKWLEDFLSLGHEFSRTVKIITTSRQVPEVEKHMHRSCVVDLRLDRLHVDQDISIFVTRQLENSNLELTVTEIKEIKDALCEKGKGLFLYARLMIDELLLSPQNIGTRVHNLPDGLGDLYTDLLRESVTRSGNFTRLQRLILEWVTHSARPMRILELTAMVESLPDRAGLQIASNVKDAVRTACGPLLEICEDGVVQVIHHSLTEYLLGRQVEHTRTTSGGREYHTVDSKAVHTMMAQTCLRYLMNGPLREWDITEEREDRSSDRKSLFLKFYFLRYAIQEWQFHVLQSGNLGNDLIRHLDAFCQDSSHDYQAWNQIWIAYQDDLPSCCSVLHVAAYSGLVPLVAHLLSQGSTLDIRDADKQTPLVYAITRGQHEVVTLLLKHGASHGTKVKRKEYTSKLQIIAYACKLNKVEVVRSLVQAGVDPMTKVSIGVGSATRLTPGPLDPQGEPYYWKSTKDSTALASAIEVGSVEAVLELIRLVDLESLCPDNLVHLAAERGNDEILSALLENDTCKRSIDKHDEYGDTPLYLAARNRNAATVRILLDHGADVSILSMNRNFPPEPPTQDESTAHPLLPPSYTPLHAWGLGIPLGDSSTQDSDGMETCLDLLLNAGCDINARDHRGRTALFEWPSLHWASMSIKNFLFALLSRGAAATLLDFDGQTPLHNSLRQVYPDVAKILTEAGCGINVQRNTDGMTVLMCNASEQNSPSPAEFHKLGADFDLQDWQGNTALHHYCKTYPCLITAGADIEAIDFKGNNIFHHFVKEEPASWSDREPRAEMIIELGAPYHQANHEGRTALHAAATIEDEFRTGSDQRTWLEFLLQPSMQFDINSKDKDGVTALHLASAVSDINTLTLIQNGADLYLRDRLGRTPLHFAAIGGQSNVVGLLLETHEPNLMFINHQCSNRRSALHEASRSGSPECVSLLLNGSADLSLTDERGRTALHAAAGFKEIPEAQKMEPVYHSQPASLADSRSTFQRRKRKNDFISLVSREICSSGDDARCIGEVVRLLLAAGADPNWPDKNGLRPLDVAISLGCASVVEILRDHMAEPRVQSFDHIRVSPLTMSNDQIKQIVDSTEVPEDHARFLAQLFATGNERLVEEFVRAKELKLIDKDNDNALQSGIFLLPHFGLTSMLERLLPYIGEATPSIIPFLLERATHRSLCNLTMFKLLIRKLPPVQQLLPAEKSVLVTSLITLSAGRRWWHPKALALFLEAGIVDVQSAVASHDAIQSALFSSSPSCRCKWNGETLRILLNHGADPNAVQSEPGWPSLYIAVRDGASLETVDLLLKYGASVGARDSGLLNSAIQSRNLAMVELLLKAGADVNGADDDRNIPLLQRIYCSKLGENPEARVRLRCRFFFGMVPIH
ncbi:hypothetical protein N7452_008475 [Penicillium brevicompactum]|uniref:GPI inositol-deacylase winged helix domain-containing protein n=1 Tax=Penicillium brevicompactum TaxID=5074 RepID=A0A9W9UBB6_PENBR|nr:hypothetical protein N7452_008475 [Penicillium brevicompactum]